MFDLSTWNLSVPTPPTPTEISAARIQNGYSSQYFRNDGNQTVVFWVPVTGSRTEDASYPRSELRETYADGRLHNWYYKDGDNYLNAVLAVNVVPSKNKVIVGQIHSKDQPGSENDPLAKLQYHYKNGTGRLELLYRAQPGSSSVQNILLAQNVDLNERFSYQLRITSTGRLGVTVKSSGDNGSFYKQLSSSWSRQLLYYKAGAYIQDNQGYSIEGGRVTFYSLNTLHRH
ncbi:MULTISPECIES: polysaccharide lyase family 7 protein [Pseudomonas]|uniref:Alginate lyase n=1 Tax=Pseudomonas segetis TaxID=298908 RepID=A0A239AGN0_9PSED|nr:MULTISPECIES: polysaccharide lyase family 7 protein [Pseudomonas]SNR94541.1 Alginate lyase [Pseudomonas segetis]